MLRERHAGVRDTDTIDGCLKASVKALEGRGSCNQPSLAYSRLSHIGEQESTPGHWPLYDAPQRDDDIFSSHALHFSAWWSPT